MDCQPRHTDSLNPVTPWPPTPSTRGASNGTLAPTISRVDATQTVGTPGYEIAVNTTGESLTYSVDKGALTANADGTYTYIAPADARGPVSFALTGTAADGRSVTATVDLATFSSLGVTPEGGQQTVTLLSAASPTAASDQAGPLVRIGEVASGTVVTDSYALPVGKILAIDPITVTYVDGGVAEVTTILDPTATDVPVAGTPTVGAPDSNTGTVTGTLNFIDPAGLALTYTVINDPDSPILTVTSGGGFSYTPTAAMRGTAATGGATTGTFTVVASNPTGASAQVVVTVPISPKVTNTGPATIAVGQGPEQLAITPDGKHLYVTNNNGNTVSVIDTATNTVTGTIGVGNYPSAISLTPDGQHLYVTNINGATVSVIRTATNTVTATISVGGHPDALAFNADGTEAVVGIHGDNVVPSTVSLINTATNTVQATMVFGDGQQTSPDGVAIVGGTVYVTDYQSSVLRSITNLGPHAIQTGIALGGFGLVLPLDPVLSSDGTKLYIAERFVTGQGPTVAVVDLPSASLVQQFAVPAGVQEMVESPDGTSLYVTNGDSTVSLLDLATGAVTTAVTYPLGGGTGIAISPDGTRLYATNYGANTVLVNDITPV